MSGAMPIHDDCAVTVTTFPCGCLANDRTGVHRPCSAIAPVWREARRVADGANVGAAEERRIAAAITAHLEAAGVGK